MDARRQSLNRHVKAYDRDLYVERISSGMLQIHRRAIRWESFDLGAGVLLRYSRPQPQLILPLTEDWTLRSNPVDWGIEPVLSRLKEMDSYRDDSIGEGMRRDRERKAELKERARRNNHRARALDMRRDFAKATNEINTSTMEKVDPRRAKDGHL